MRCAGVISNAVTATSMPLSHVAARFDHPPAHNTTAKDCVLSGAEGEHSMKPNEPNAVCRSHIQCNSSYVNAAKPCDHRGRMMGGVVGRVHAARCSAAMAGSRQEKSKGEARYLPADC